MLKFKNPAIWLGIGILHLTQEPDFSKTSGLNRIINVIMVHYLDPKNLHINRLFFFANSKKPYFGGIFGHLPKIRFFPKNMALPVFYLKGTLTWWKVSQKPYEPFWRKHVSLLTHVQKRKRFSWKVQIWTLVFNFDLPDLLIKLLPRVCLNVWLKVWLNKIKKNDAEKILNALGESQ